MTVITPQHRQRLDEVRQRKRAARDKMNAAKAAIQIASEHQDPSAAGHAEIALEMARGEESLAVELESALLHQVAGIGDGGFASGSFLDDPNTVRVLEQAANSSMPVGSMMLGPVTSRETLVSQMQTGTWGGKTLAAATGIVSIPDTSRVGPYQGITAQLRRRLSVLDLLPTQPMDGKSFDYTQASGSQDTAGETAEAALKPPGELLLVDAQVIAKTIAHWLKIPRQQAADVPALATVAESRLSYGVLRRLEDQVIGGDGTGENILGILHTTGVASVPFVAGEPLSDLTLDAITTVFLSDAEPDAVVVNPTDLATMLKAKATGSGERLDSEGAFSDLPQTMWGLPAIPSKVMPAGQALVGSFGTGATVYVREAVNVRISDSDQDDFLRNRFTMLGEGRFGLAVWQPTAFAIVHLA